MHTPSQRGEECARNAQLKLAGYPNWLASCQSCPVSCHRLDGGVSRLTQELSTWESWEQHGQGCTNAEHRRNTDRGEKVSPTAHSTTHTYTHTTVDRERQAVCQGLFTGLNPQNFSAAHFPDKVVHFRGP